MSTSVELTTLLVVSCCLGSFTAVSSVDSDENYNPSDLLTSESSMFVLVPTNKIDSSVQQRFDEHENVPQSEQHINKEVESNKLVEPMRRIHIGNDYMRELNDYSRMPMVQDTADDPRILQEMMQEILRKQPLQEQNENQRPPVLQTADDDHWSKQPIKEYPGGLKTISDVNHNGRPRTYIKNLVPINFKVKLCKDEASPVTYRRHHAEDEEEEDAVPRLSAEEKLEAAITALHDAEIGLGDPPAGETPSEETFNTCNSFVTRLSKKLPAGCITNFIGLSST